MKEIDYSFLLIRISKGDKDEAFRTLYEATKNHAYKLIYYLSPSKEDIGDIMSEVYIELLRCVEKYQPDQPFIPWFNGLIVRQVRSWKRKNWRLYRIVERLKLLTDVSLDRKAEAQFSEVGDHLELLPALRALPQKAKEIIVLRYYQDCSLEEISELLSIPIGTVKSRHHHALKKLRRSFEEMNGGKEREDYVYRATIK